MTTKVIPYMGRYAVQIHHGNQYFTLKPRDTRKEANWQKAQFDKMLTIYRDEICKQQRENCADAYQTSVLTEEMDEVVILNAKQPTT